MPKSEPPPKKEEDFSPRIVVTEEYDPKTNQTKRITETVLPGDQRSSPKRGVATDHVQEVFERRRIFEETLESERRLLKVQDKELGRRSEEERLREIYGGGVVRNEKEREEPKDLSRLVRQDIEEHVYALIRGNLTASNSLEVRVPSLLVAMSEIEAGQQLYYTIEDGGKIEFKVNNDGSAQGKVTLSRRGGGTAFGIILPEAICKKMGIDDKTWLNVKASDDAAFAIEKAKLSKRMSQRMSETAKKLRRSF